MSCLPCHHYPLLIVKEEAQYQDESQDQAQQHLLKPPEHVHGRHWTVIEKIYSKDTTDISSKKKNHQNRDTYDNGG